MTPKTRKVKACGCEKPIVTKDEDGHITTRYILCRKHARERGITLPPKKKNTTSN